jgi:hypothetical protein
MNRPNVNDFWNFPAGWRGLLALVLHRGTKNNAAIAPISCLTWRQKSGSNHPGGPPVTRGDFGCGKRDGHNHPSRTPVHSVKLPILIHEPVLSDVQLYVSLSWSKSSQNVNGSHFSIRKLTTSYQTSKMVYKEVLSHVHSSWSFEMYPLFLFPFLAYVSSPT